MEKSSKDPFKIASMMNAWTRSMNDIMGTVSQVWPNEENREGEAEAKDGENKEEKGKSTAGDAGTAMNEAFKAWQTIVSSMATPESMASFIKGTGALPEIAARFSQSIMSSLSEMQNKMGQRMHRMGESMESYHFEKNDENIFHFFTEMYEKEFRKYYHIPQLGLSREYQERINHMADSFNLFQTHHAEFLRLLYLPFQRSVWVMQEKIADLAEKGRLPDDSREYYRMWIKVLEGHFMLLFQTREYTETMAKTISSLSKFSEAKNAVLEDMIKGLPVVRKSEMEELAREVYELKKHIRRLEKNGKEAGRVPGNDRNEKEEVGDDAVQGTG